MVRRFSSLLVLELSTPKLINHVINRSCDWSRTDHFILQFAHFHNHGIDCQFHVTEGQTSGTSVEKIC